MRTIHAEKNARSYIKYSLHFFLSGWHSSLASPPIRIVRYYPEEKTMINQLKTERLVLRPFLKTDGENLYRYLSDPEVVKYEPYLPFSHEEAVREAERRAGDSTFLAVCLKDGSLIGNLYFAPSDCES
jgi:RimJ/RimL family protein N-acetyltransferase